MNPLLFKTASSTELLSQINAERRKSKLPPLKVDFRLEFAAKKKLQDMETRKYFSHNTPDGKKPWVFVDQAKYPGSWLGENLAKDFKTSKEAVDAWMKSPLHKKNILDKNYTETGIAVVGDTVVQFFGSR